MQNRAVAQRFALIADLLEIGGESLFRINAYRRAARAIEGLSEDVAAVAARGGLTEIPGIGKALAEKIVEFLATGTMHAYEELAASLPPGLATLMLVPEVGPKTALLLHEHLGITTLDELEAACAAGRIRELPRMGQRTEEAILRGIAMVRRQAGRRPLGFVLPVAQELVERLRAVPGVKQVSAAGSIRRMKETVGDLDILAASRAPGRVMEIFTSAPEVGEVLAQGSTKSSVVLDVGLQADLRVVEPAAFGAALQYFTGSKEHNVALRERAARAGLKLNEYGLWRSGDSRGGDDRRVAGHRVAGRTEAGIYRALGLPWIPPELREDQGEIEAAETGRLPRLIEVEDIRGEVHAHTSWSDGADSVEAIAAAAAAMGYEYVCITDHSQSLKVARGVPAADLREHIRQVRALSDLLGIAVLIGTECDISAAGALDYPDDLLAELDLVIASVHTRFRMSREAMTSRIVRAMESGHVDILGHPTGRLLGARDPYEVDIEAVVDAAVRTGTALEINAAPERLDLKDTGVRLARERGARLAIGTDAHSCAQLRYMPLGVGTARRGWVEAREVINTLPLASLREVLGHREGRSRRTR